MKILFGTVEELFSELKEKNQTEARIEPIVQRKMIGKNISVPYLIHQIKVILRKLRTLIEGMVAEVVIEYHTYPRVSDEQVSVEGVVHASHAKEKSEAVRKANELREDIETLAKDYSITLKRGFFAETDECFLGSIKR
jgi:hypothetical protein